jgi:hypothetical protein
MPDAYDLRCCSGVARADDGVMLLPKAMAGDWLRERSSNDVSPCGVGGPTGPPWAFGFMESLRNLRASVGLMVLAPRPEMCGAVDCLLLDEDEGVCDRCAGDLPGERAWLRGKVPWSGVIVDTVRCPGRCLGGGWKDFALAERCVFGSLGTPVAVGRLVPRVSRRLPLFNEGERPMRDCDISPANLVASGRPSKLLVGSIPGPTLFRGARAAGFGGP